jgi:hypothetical protein
VFLSRPILNSVRSVTRSHHTSFISSTSVTRDGARYSWSPRTNTCSKSVCVVLSRPGTNTCSKSVCVFLSRPILGSVRSVNQVITSVVSYHRQSHETMLGVCPLTQSPSLFPSSSGTRASVLRALCPSPHPSHSIVNSSALFVLKSANP